MEIVTDNCIVQLYKTKREGPLPETAFGALYKSDWENVILAGGSDYAQMFSDQLPFHVLNNSIKLSKDRTPLLVDTDVTTCISHAFYARRSSLWAKIVPDELDIRRNTFPLNIAGKGFTCSPVNGISVGLQSSANADGSYTNVVPCVVTEAPLRNGLNVCKYKCATQVHWEFVVVYIGQLSIDNTGYPPEICEIWFSY